MRGGNRTQEEKEGKEIKESGEGRIGEQKVKIR